jgi:hypothetical protein
VENKTPLYPLIIMKKLLFFITIIALLSACTKENTNCTDCKEITISGRVLNKLTNQGIAKQEVLIKTPKKDPFCLACSENVIASAITDEAGNYSIKVTTDTIQQPNLFVRIGSPSSEYFYEQSNGVFISSSKSQKANFEVSLKTKLQIKMKRVGTEKIENASINHYYNNDPFQFQDFLTIDASEIKSQTINTETAADVYTKIRWTKVLNALENKVEEHTDSVFCKKGVVTTFELSF